MDLNKPLHMYQLLRDGIAIIDREINSPRKGLTAAWQREISVLHPREIPEKYAGRFNAIHARVTTVCKTGDQGTIAASINNMTDIEVNEIIRLLRGLCTEIKAEIEP